MVHVHIYQVTISKTIQKVAHWCSPLTHGGPCFVHHNIALLMLCNLKRLNRKSVLKFTYWTKLPTIELIQGCLSLETHP